MLLPLFVFLRQTMRAGPVSCCDGVGGSSKKYPVVYFHPPATTAMQAAINLYPLIASQHDLSLADKGSQPLASCTSGSPEGGMQDHGNVF